MLLTLYHTMRSIACIIVFNMDKTDKICYYTYI